MKHALLGLLFLVPALAHADSCPESSRINLKIDCRFELMGTGQKRVQQSDATRWDALRLATAPRVSMPFTDHRLSAELGCSKPAQKAPWQWQLEVALRRKGRGAEATRLSIISGIDFANRARTRKPLVVESYHFFDPAVVVNGLKATRIDYTCRLSARPAVAKRRGK